MSMMTVLEKNVSIVAQVHMDIAQEVLLNIIGMVQLENADIAGPLHHQEVVLEVLIKSM